MANTLPYPVLERRLMGERALPVLTDEALFADCGVRVAFAGREEGVSEGPYASLNCGLHVGDDEAAVRYNRKLLFEALDAPDVFPIIPSQVHGTDVLVVSPGTNAAKAQEKALEGADGLIVGKRNVAALLNFADCLPVVLVAPGNWTSVLHAGWRGAVGHIAAKGADRLCAEAGCSAADVNAYIGPHIRSECFEVGSDVAARFKAEFGSEALADARHVSLAAAVSADLVSVGLARARIADAGVCTVCQNDRYYSYRASGGTCGRHAALAFSA